MLQNYKSKVLILCVVIVVGLCGCDAINAIKEYFQEPEDKPAPAAQPIVGTPAPQATPPVAQPKPITVVEPLKANTLARVGGWSMTLEEFNDRLQALKEVVPDFDINDPEAKKLILEELVNQQVLVTDAEQTGLARQKDIVAAVDEFRRTLIVREVARVLTESVTTTEAEALAFYEQNKASLVGPDEWHVREIVVPTKAEATSILAEVLNGADFAETARLRSRGKSAPNGGDLGFITQEPFPAMGEALLPLEAGQVSDVFEGPEGFYFVRLEEKKPGAQMTFDELKEEIIQSQTLLKQQQIILNHLDALKSKIPIETNTKLIE